VQVGDVVSVYSARQLKQIEEHKGQEGEVAVPPDDFTVKAIFEMGYYEYDANIVLTSIRNAQDLFQLRRDVHGLLVMLDDPYQANIVAGQLQATLGLGYTLRSWTRDNAQILAALMVEKKVMFVLLVLVVIVAAFGIMNSQITFVVQKTREIGMLKALGATRAQLIGLFMGQSLVVGIIGVLGGLGLGLLMVEVRNPFLHTMNRLTGLELFPREIYSFSELPAHTVPLDVALICGTALVICILAGLGPAWNASRLQPVEALRHE
jgi:lipoprotein-releasing system permease protein